MSHASAVAQSENEMIQKFGENSHAEYFRIGKSITVTWMAGYQLYACLSCRLNECEHTRRIERYRNENEELSASPPIEMGRGV